MLSKSRISGHTHERTEVRISGCWIIPISVYKTEKDVMEFVCSLEETASSSTATFFAANISISDHEFSVEDIDTRVKFAPKTKVQVVEFIWNQLADSFAPFMMHYTDRRCIPFLENIQCAFLTMSC
jgi:hypothetical protein